MREHPSKEDEGKRMTVQSGSATATANLLDSLYYSADFEDEDEDGDSKDIAPPRANSDEGSEDEPAGFGCSLCDDPAWSGFCEQCRMQTCEYCRLRWDGQAQCTCTV